MAVCNARYRFTVVDIAALSHDSDAGVFARSCFRSQLIQGKLAILPPSTLPGSEVQSPHVFVGDEAFPLKVNMMRPYSGTNLTTEQRIYNYHHSRARQVVENAFGILAARWRVFGKAMECSIEKAEDITKACVSLHNFLCASDTVKSTGKGTYPAAWWMTEIILANGDRWFRETPTSLGQDASQLTELHVLAQKFMTT
ncbi:hypothetical protein LDENG_00190140 [Lucifuga dentata]|nr:hypothetical protein LDENG_00190140 [Lucifuga dentata]